MMFTDLILTYSPEDFKGLDSIYPDYEARAKEAMEKARKERHIQRVAEHLAWAAPEKLPPKNGGRCCWCGAVTKIHNTSEDFTVTVCPNPACTYYDEHTN